MADKIEEEIEKALAEGSLDKAVKVLKTLSEEELAQLDPKLRKKLLQALEEEVSALSPEASSEKKKEYEKELERLTAVDLAFQNVFKDVSPELAQNQDVALNPEIQQQTVLASIRDTLLPQLETRQSQERASEVLQVITQEQSIQQSIVNNRAPTPEEIITAPEQQPDNPQRGEEHQETKGKQQEEPKKEEPKKADPKQEQQKQKPQKAKGLKGMVKELTEKLTKPPKAKKAPREQAPQQDNSSVDLAGRQAAALREQEDRERMEAQGKAIAALGVATGSPMMAAAMAIGNEFRKYAESHGIQQQMVSAANGSLVVAQAASTETSVVPAPTSEAKIA